MNQPVTGITILYDSECGMCVRLKEWVLAQPAYLSIEAIPMQSKECHERYPDLEDRIQAGQFLCIDNNGAVYVDAEARILCLWALKKYRSISFTVARTPMRSLLTMLMEKISRNRHAISDLIGLSKQQGSANGKK